MIKTIQCAFCIHYEPDRKPQDGEQRLLARGCCAAFPNGIPEAIVEGRHDHRLPYPGDHGVRLELIPGLTPALLGDLPEPMRKAS